jgi:4-hydroxy-tetrahydrodipicolinate reductase
MFRIIVVGLGPIGIAAARVVRQSSDLKLVGMVDIDPGKIGRRSSEFLDASPGSKPDASSAESDDDVRVSASIEEVSRSTRADVAIVCTSSRFDLLEPMLRTCIVQRLHVVSSCEEMAWPAYRHASLAAQIDAEARQAGVALLGTGVNPGYVMDLLAVQISSMVSKVTRVRCLRRVDALKRRLPLQQKVGSTLRVEEFDDLKAQGQIGHKGLAESICLIAAGLGRSVEPGGVRESLEPVVAEHEIECGLGVIEPGRVRGMHNRGLWTGEGLTIELDLLMACDEPNPRDEIELEGPVPMKLVIPHSTPGDSATVAALVNHSRVIGRASPGLKTMLDLPVAGAR